MNTDPLIGQVVLDRYRIVLRLAEGGMGVLYLARMEGAAGFVKPVIVKRIQQRLAGRPSVVKLFAREAQIMSNLRHPGIVQILDFRSEGDLDLMVLEYVHGFNLAHWLEFMSGRGRALEPDLAV